MQHSTNHSVAQPQGCAATTSTWFQNISVTQKAPCTQQAVLDLTRAQSHSGSHFPVGGVAVWSVDADAVMPVPASPRGVQVVVCVLDSSCGCVIFPRGGAAYSSALHCGCWGCGPLGASVNTGAPASSAVFSPIGWMPRRGWLGHGNESLCSSLEESPTYFISIPTFSARKKKK